MGERGGINAYHYVHNNALNLYDSFGLFAYFTEEDINESKNEMKCPGWQHQWKYKKWDTNIDTISKILCCCSNEGRNLVEKLSKIKFFKFKTYLTKWRRHDGKEEWVEETGVKGFTRNKSAIYVKSDITIEVALMVIIHESYHTEQPKAKTKKEYVEQEIEARLKTELFYIKHGFPETIEGYRNSDKTVNVKAIEKDVNKKPIYTDEFLSSETVGKEPLNGEWICK